MGVDTSCRASGWWPTSATPARVLAAAALALTAVLAIAAPAAGAAQGIHTIRHVVVIMQENRSFDNYFGTFPGADGIPMRDGKPIACLPDPLARHCIPPHHDPHDVDLGQWHSPWSYADDYDKGRMDGFARTATICLTAAGNPPCKPNPHTPIEAMGYHNQREIPNYWAYAKNFVLQDHMFEPTTSWSLPAHLYLVSEWSALCTAPGDPLSCRTDITGPAFPPDFGPPPHPPPNYAWTDLTWLLHRDNVSWGYYVKKGPEPDCENSNAYCGYKDQQPQTPGIWNPLPYFTDVHQDHQLSDIRDTSAFLAEARKGTLPAVSWVIPSGLVSEHPSSPISAGQAYVTNLINTVALGPDWNSTAIFLAWDDWGGFYDQVKPPVIDGAGYGFRVPGLVISPYARRHYIDHQQLSFDAYAKFIEDDFLSGQRLNPKTDGRPDPRPDVREDAPGLGDLRRDFNFNQKPRPPLILPTNPRQHG